MLVWFFFLAFEVVFVVVVVVVAIHLGAVLILGFSPCAQVLGNGDGKKPCEWQRNHHFASSPVPLAAKPLPSQISSQ